MVDPRGERGGGIVSPATAGRLPGDGTDRGRGANGGGQPAGGFGFDRWDLDDRAQTALGEVVSELKKNAALSVVLEGYTDPQGAGAYNMELSQRRVEAVRRYLVGRGWSCGGSPRSAWVCWRRPTSRTDRSGGSP
jgi:OmpA family